jgi:hypothetical protein
VNAARVPNFTPEQRQAALAKAERLGDVAQIRILFITESPNHRAGAGNRGAERYRERR